MLTVAFYLGGRDVSVRDSVKSAIGQVGKPKYRVTSCMARGGLGRSDRVTGAALVVTEATNDESVCEIYSGVCPVVRLRCTDRTLGKFDASIVVEGEEVDSRTITLAEVARGDLLPWSLGERGGAVPTVEADPETGSADMSTEQPAEPAGSVSVPRETSDAPAPPSDPPLSANTEDLGSMISKEEPVASASAETATNGSHSRRRNRARSSG